MIRALIEPIIFLMVLLGLVWLCYFSLPKYYRQGYSLERGKNLRLVKGAYVGCSPRIAKIVDVKIDPKTEDRWVKYVYLTPEEAAKQFDWAFFDKGLKVRLSSSENNEDRSDEGEEWKKNN